MSWLAENVEHAAGRPGLRIGRAVHDPRHPGEHDRPRAHRARLERHVEDRARYPPPADGRSRLAQGELLGVRGRIAAVSRSLPATRQPHRRGPRPRRSGRRRAPRRARLRRARRMKCSSRPKKRFAPTGEASALPSVGAYGRSVLVPGRDAIAASRGRTRRSTLDDTTTATSAYRGDRAGRRRARAAGRQRPRPPPRSSPARSWCGSAASRPSARTSFHSRSACARRRGAAARPGGAVGGSQPHRPRVGRGMDPGRPRPQDAPRGRWQELQWQFVRERVRRRIRGSLESFGGHRRTRGVAEPDPLGRPGGRGVKVAAVDTGVAYRDRGKKFARSPDLKRRQFKAARDSSTATRSRSTRTATAPTSPRPSASGPTASSSPASPTARS